MKMGNAECGVRNRKAGPVGSRGAGETLPFHPGPIVIPALGSSTQGQARRGTGRPDTRAGLRGTGENRASTGHYGK